MSIDGWDIARAVVMLLVLLAVLKSGHDALKILRGNRDMKRRNRGQCRRCGYDLRGNQSGTCPECGAETNLRWK